MCTLNSMQTNSTQAAGRGMEGGGLALVLHVRTNPCENKNDEQSHHSTDPLQQSHIASLQGTIRRTMEGNGMVVHKPHGAHATRATVAAPQAGPTAAAVPSEVSSMESSGSRSGMPPRFLVEDRPKP